VTQEVACGIKVGRLAREVDVEALERRERDEAGYGASAP